MGNEPFFPLKSLQCRRGRLYFSINNSFSLNVDVAFGFMVSFTCGGNRYTEALIFLFILNFVFFLALSFFFLLKTSHGMVECSKFQYLLSGDLKYSVLAHAHVLIMNS